MSKPTQQSKKSQIAILLADDDEELRFILSRLLTKAGYIVEEVSDSTTLARRLSELSAQSPRLRNIHLVISDIYMPGGTALEVIEKRRETVTDIPIILISSAHDPNIISKAEELGVHAVLSKPVDMVKLTQLIEECVSTN